MLKQAINEVEEGIRQIENGLLNGEDAGSNDTLKIKSGAEFLAARKSKRAP